jgi:ribosome-associated protein
MWQECSLACTILFFNMGHPGGMADDLHVTRELVIPAAELFERFSRSSGPGGQGVNTTDSRVELRFDLARSPSLPTHLRQRALGRLRHRLAGGVIAVTASQYRGQLANRQAARDRLAALLAAAIEPPPPRRRPTKPTNGSQQRRLAAKKRRSEVKRHRRRGEPGDA